MAEARVIKFCTYVVYVKSQHRDDISPLNGRVQCHMTHFKFQAPNYISGTAEARVVKFCMLIAYTKC